MIGDFSLQIVTSPGTATISLPATAPQGRLTWASRFATRQPVSYVLDNLVQQEWGMGTFIPGSPPTITRDVVMRNSLGSQAKINFTGQTRCYSGLLSAHLLTSLGKGTGRNMLHNPLFQIAQRGTSALAPATGKVGIDRWIRETSGAGTCTHQQITLGDADRIALGDGAAWKAAQLVVAGSSGAGDYEIFSQTIEDPRRIAGKPITISFWARSAIGGFNIGVALFQQFDQFNAPPNVASPPQVITLSTVWQRFILTFQAASGQGKNLQGSIWTRVRLWLSSGATNAALAGTGVQSGTVQLWGMQAEIGNLATALEYPTPAVDLANAMRFYQPYTACVYGTFGAAATTVFGQLALPVPMMFAPAVVLSNITYLNGSALAVQGEGLSYYQRVKISLTCTTAAYCYAMFDMTLSSEP